MIAIDKPEQAPPRGREVGSLIAGVFGLVFVGVNSADLTTPVRLVLVAGAGAALALIVGLGLRSLRQAGAPPAHGDGSPFGRTYWTIVVVEVIALFAGSRLITAWGHPDLGVAWVAFVVGTHFFALGHLFGLARFHALGAVVTALALAGFLLGALDRPEAVAVVSGVASGFVLLGFGIWAVASPDPVSPGARRGR